MSPLDDELRATLRSRADVLTPSADPLAGIESRARGIRRRRTIASVVGAGLAVAVIAVAVPSVLPSQGTDPSGFATPTPTTPTAAPVTAFTLDPATPWAPRGAIPEIPTDRFRSAWLAKHPGTTFSALFSQVYEPSQKAEMAFVSDGTDGARYGFVTEGATGPTFLYDERLHDSTKVLAFSLPGDEVGRVLAIADPRVRIFEKTGDGATYEPMTLIAEGVAITAREAASTLRVKAPDDTVLFDGPVPASTVEGPPAAQPANLLTWPTRGAGESDLLPAAKQALAPQLQATDATVELKVLFAGDTDSGVKYVMGQAWKKGSATAYPFSYATGGTNGPAVFIGPANKKSPPALAFLIDSLPGTSVELLVVVPTPRTGLVSYDDNASGSFRPIGGQDYLDGVVLIDRAIGETDDRMEILDGNGDLDNPTYRGPVAPFLCGLTECG
jgi:hypothetical protein